mmetsp:Transcript_84288/g.161133  ORF Transcript_84288/g.161133 Transcript_84288/m.161133 type:complete len:505 (-) Transcript_84288:38-1552(-)
MPNPNFSPIHQIVGTASMANCCNPRDNGARGEETVMVVSTSEVAPILDMTAMLRAQTNAIQELSATAFQLQQACAKLIGAEEKPISKALEPKENVERRYSRKRTLEPTKVQVSMTTERIFSLDTIEQTFGAQIMVILCWKCPPGEEPPPPDEDDGDWTPDWVPKFRVRSVMEEIMAPDTHFTTEDINGTLWVKGTILLLVRIAEPLELTSFPNDCQDLPITIESKMSTDQVRWVEPVEDGVPQPSALLMKSRCQLNDFKLVKEIPFTHTMYMIDTGRGRKFSSMTMTVKVVRKSFYYLLNVGLILFWIISFVFCAWGLHPCDIDGRNDMDFNLILTAVAFKLVLTDLLPAVSYTTRLDAYLFVSFAFLMAITVSHTMLPHLVVSNSDMSPLSLAPVVFDSDKEQDLFDYDAYSLFIFAGAWILWNLGYAIYVCIKAQSEYSQFVRKAKEDQKFFDGNRNTVRKSAVGETAATAGDICRTESTASNICRTESTASTLVAPATSTM